MSAKQPPALSAASTSSAAPPLSRRAAKKPFHIPRSTLDVSGYRAELLEASPAHLVRRAFGAVLTSRKFWVYVGLQLLAAWLGWGQVMLCVGILWGMVEGTGKREGGLSPWSVFNPGVERMEGSTDMQALEGELRGERGRWVR